LRHADKVRPSPAGEVKSEQGVRENRITQPKVTCDRPAQIVYQEDGTEHRSTRYRIEQRANETDNSQRRARLPGMPIRSDVEMTTSIGTSFMPPSSSMKAITSPLMMRPTQRTTFDV